MVSISLDWTILWQLANFLALIWLLNTILYKPVRKMLQNRATHNAEMKSNIETDLEAAQKDESALTMRRLQTRQEGKAIWEDLKKQAQAEELDKLQQAMQKNNEFLGEKRAEIQNQIELAGAKLDHEVEQFARDIAGKILQRSLS